jgi:DNA-directed RNA polymerase subunit F
VSNDSTIIKNLMSGVKDEINAVTSASDILANTIKTVLPQIEDELTAVNNVTLAYANRRTELKGL